MGAGLGMDVASITDGRFSGGYVIYPLPRVRVRVISLLFLFFFLIPFPGHESRHTSHYHYHSHSRSHGFCIGHVVPEAQVGGPIALVQDGDIISVDAIKNTIELRVSPEELEKRRKTWVAPPLKASQGTLYKYIKSVTDASHGCITDA